MDFVSAAMRLRGIFKRAEPVIRQAAARLGSNAQNGRGFLITSINLFGSGLKFPEYHLGVIADPAMCLSPLRQAEAAALADRSRIAPVTEG